MTTAFEDALALCRELIPWNGKGGYWTEKAMHILVKAVEETIVTTSDEPAGAPRFLPVHPFVKQFKDAHDEAGDIVLSRDREGRNAANSPKSQFESTAFVLGLMSMKLARARSYLAAGNFHKFKEELQDVSNYSIFAIVFEQPEVPVTTIKTCALISAHGPHVVQSVSPFGCPGYCGLHKRHAAHDTEIAVPQTDEDMSSVGKGMSSVNRVLVNCPGSLS